MARSHYILIATLVISFIAILAIVLINMLDKEGRLVPRLGRHVFVLASPLFTIAGASLTFRHHRWLPMAALIVAATAAILIVWGCVIDYLVWSRTPPGHDVMHFGAFVAMLCSLLMCVGLLTAGAVSLIVARRRVTRTEPGIVMDSIPPAREP